MKVNYSAFLPPLYLLTASHLPTVLLLDSLPLSLLFLRLLLQPHLLLCPFVAPQFNPTPATGFELGWELWDCHFDFTFWATLFTQTFTDPILYPFQVFSFHPRLLIQWFKKNKQNLSIYRDQHIYPSVYSNSQFWLPTKTDVLLNFPHIWKVAKVKKPVLGARTNTWLVVMSLTWQRYQFPLWHHTKQRSWTSRRSNNRFF